MAVERREPDDQLAVGRHRSPGRRRRWSRPGRPRGSRSRSSRRCPWRTGTWARAWRSRESGTDPTDVAGQLEDAPALAVALRLVRVLAGDEPPGAVGEEADLGVDVRSSGIGLLRSLRREGGVHPLMTERRDSLRTRRGCCRHHRTPPRPSTRRPGSGYCSSSWRLLRLSFCRWSTPRPRGSSAPISPTATQLRFLRVRALIAPPCRPIRWHRRRKHDAGVRCDLADGCLPSPDRTSCADGPVLDRLRSTFALREAVVGLHAGANICSCAARRRSCTPTSTRSTRRSSSATILACGAGR